MFGICCCFIRYSGLQVTRMTDTTGQALRSYKSLCCFWSNRPAELVLLMCQQVDFASQGFHPWVVKEPLTVVFMMGVALIFMIINPQTFTLPFFWWCSVRPRWQAKMIWVLLVSLSPRRHSGDLNVRPLSPQLGFSIHQVMLAHSLTS